MLSVGFVLGRTIPSWRLVVDAEIAKLRRFQDFMRAEDKLVFHDLLDQCKLYAPYASSIASPVKEVPLLVSILFGQHKKIVELEKRVLLLETIAKDSHLAVGPPRIQGRSPENLVIDSD